MPFGFGSEGVDIAELLALLAANTAPLVLGGGLDAAGDVTQRGQIVPVVLQTPVIDFTVFPQTVAFLNSTIPGKVFLPMTNANFVRGRLVAVAGTLVTRPQGTIGNNAGVNNFLSVAADLVSAAQFAAGAGAESAVAGSDVTQVPADLATPMAIKVTTAGAGVGTTCTGRIYIPGWLVDV